MLNFVVWVLAGLCLALIVLAYLAFRSLGNFFSGLFEIFKPK